MRHIPWTVTVLLLLSSLCYPQDAPSTDPETIRQLVQQVKDLQERVKLLESQQNHTDASTPDSPNLPMPPAEPADQTPAPTVGQELHEAHGIQWRGFGEVDYKVLSQRAPELGTYGFVPGSQGNFYTGDFGLFLTSKLTDKASVLSEIVFEEGDAQSYRVDLRRLLLKYDYNDHLKMSFGRYQTNIGYYNWAFRSAAWLQTTADRPLVMEFASNGGLLPTQAIGVSATGTIPSGKLGLNYVAEYGSSDTMRPDLNGDGQVTDENNSNQVNVGFFLRPDRVPGLQIGASYYHDKISNFVQGPSLRYGQSIVNGYVVYVAHGIEFLNEGFLIRDAALHFSNAIYNTPALYSQISKQVGHFRPFFRYQYVNASSNDSIYNDVGLRFGPSFGARYDLNEYVAFKAQLDHTARRDEPDLNGLQLQLAFTF
ncbi:MAG TPA: hypothetical protein VIH75_03485 [Candidatus Sulfotelmatobacter sp.]